MTSSGFFPRDNRMAIAFAAIGIACILYGVTVMTLWSGTWFFAVWHVIGAALLGVAWAIHSGAWGQVPVVLRRVLEIAGCLVLGIFIVCGGMALGGFGQQGEDDLDYLIVLGAQISEEHPSAVLQYRLDTACDYLERNKDTVCIVTGGKGFNEPCTEAEVMGDYLEAHGVDPQRIIREEAASNTAENIGNSMAIIGADDARVGIVTNDFHVFRSVGIARKRGLRNACGIAAPSSPWYLPNNLLRESFSIAKDFATGNL